jgi:hypothetical protein
VDREIARRIAAQPRREHLRREPQLGRIGGQRDAQERRRGRGGQRAVSVRHDLDPLLDVERGVVELEPDFGARRADRSVRARRGGDGER